MMLKSRHIVALGLLFGLGVAGLSQSATAGEVLNRVMQSKTLTLAYSPGYAPVAYFNDKNELIGFDVEVGQEIAKRLGVGFKYVTPTWDATVAGKWGGRWDIAVGSMTPTKERAQVLDFPGIYYYTPASFAVNKDNKSIQTVADLNGKHIGACGACSYDDYLKGNLKIDAEGVPPFTYDFKPGQVTTYEADDTAFADLKLGDGVRLDAVLTNLPTLDQAIKNGLPFRVVGKPVFYEPLAVAVDKGDAEFSAKIAGIIRDMHTDGTLSALSTKWFGVDLTKAE